MVRCDPVAAADVARAASTTLAIFERYLGRQRALAAEGKQWPAYPEGEFA